MDIGFTVAINEYWIGLYKILMRNFFKLIFITLFIFKFSVTIALGQSSENHFLLGTQCVLVNPLSELKSSQNEQDLANKFELLKKKIEREFDVNKGFDFVNVFSKPLVDKISKTTSSLSRRKDEANKYFRDFLQEYDINRIEPNVIDFGSLIFTDAKENLFSYLIDLETFSLINICKAYDLSKSEVQLDMEYPGDMNFILSENDMYQYSEKSCLQSDEHFHDCTESILEKFYKTEDSVDYNINLYELLLGINSEGVVAENFKKLMYMGVEENKNFTILTDEIILGSSIKGNGTIFAVKACDVPGSIKSDCSVVALTTGSIVALLLTDKLNARKRLMMKVGSNISFSNCVLTEIQNHRGLAGTQYSSYFKGMASGLQDAVVEGVEAGRGSQNVVFGVLDSAFSFTKKLVQGFSLPDYVSSVTCELDFENIAKIGQ